MQVRDITTGSYDGCPYTIVNVGSVFIILMSIDGKLHRGHIVATRGFIQKLFGQDYTKKQLDNISKYCSGIAQTTIETIRSNKK
jgi:hypothetical protein